MFCGFGEYTSLVHQYTSPGHQSSPPVQYTSPVHQSSTPVQYTSLVHQSNPVIVDGLSRPLLLHRLLWEHFKSQVHLEASEIVEIQAPVAHERYQDGICTRFYVLSENPHMHDGWHPH